MRGQLGSEQLLFLTEESTVVEEMHAFIKIKVQRVMGESCEQI